MAFDNRDEDDHVEGFDVYDDVKQPSPPRFYRRRMFWICCIPTTIIAIVVVAVILTLYVIMPKIAQGLMDKSSINLSQIVRLHVALSALTAPVAPTVLLIQSATFLLLSCRTSPTLLRLRWILS